MLCGAKANVAKCQQFMNFCESWLYDNCRLELLKNNVGRTHSITDTTFSKMETKVEIPLLVHMLELIFKPRSFWLYKLFSTFWPWYSPCDHNQCEMVLKKNVTYFPQFFMTRPVKDLPWELRTWAWCASVLLASSPNPLWKRQAFPSPTNITNSGFEFAQCQLLRPKMQTLVECWDLN